MQLFFSVTQSFILGFSLSTAIITASSIKNTYKKEPIVVSEITMQYLHKNILILLLCQWGLLVHT